MIITRLGKDVDTTRRLNPEALARTVGVLKRYARRAEAVRARRIHVAATSAVRDASNRDEFAEQVLRLTGEPLEVITGEREAALSFAGAVAGLEQSGPFMVLDIGGGSTEFVIGTTEPTDSISVQMGSVRLTERYLTTDPPASAELAAMREYIGSILSEVEAAIPVAEAAGLIAVGGTATTMQAMALSLKRYDASTIHRSTLASADARAVLLHLSGMTDSERASLPVMAPGRGDVIVAGCEILVAVMERWGFGTVLVSETDILEGLAAELLATL